MYTIEPVRTWIQEKHPNRSKITDDTDLIESRLIDSLSFVEFLYVLQEASGLQIDPEGIDLNDIRTLDAMQDAYFAAERAG